MRYFLLFIFLTCSLKGYAINNFLEVSYESADKIKVKIQNFTLGEVEVEGDLECDIARGEDYVSYDISSESFCIGEDFCRPLRGRIVKKESALVISYIQNDEFLIRGKVDLLENLVSLNIHLNAPLVLGNFEGVVEGIVSLEGTLEKPLLKGDLLMHKGRYFDLVFEEGQISFTGFWPYLRLNNSEISFVDGSKYEMDGFVNAKDLKTFFFSPEVKSKEARLGEWKVFGEKRQAGFEKEVNDRMGVLFGSYINERQEDIGAEFRYEILNDNYLKLRMLKDKSIVGFERKKEF